ncbi:hypothetical protein BKA62DRAFT_825956 [Auriculariales sp. MPI-PUGE-AT-0066]|nr:hypothetical protein BKA62DRAFT_825956 [Auriculariales sp. MPI-PUGE-AT-0066]
MRRAAAVVVTALAVALAQTLDDTCTNNTWSFNSEHRSPCSLWQDLSNMCTTKSSRSLVARLHHIGDEYQPPTFDDLCACNIVAFNLASACALCQPSFDSAQLITESDWKAQCKHYNSTGLAASTAARADGEALAVALPLWAYMTANDGIFQASFAQKIAGGAVIEPTDGQSSSVTVSSLPSSTALGAGATTDPISEKKKKDVGGIVGGVVGGIVGLALTALIAFLLLRYRSRMRNRTAFAIPRDVPAEKEFGLPADIQVQHFVPPAPSTSGHGSYDNLPAGAAAAYSAHPFSANYAVQRNVAEATRTYTSSSNYDMPHAFAGQSIMPFSDTQSIVAPSVTSSAPNTADLPVTPFMYGSLGRTVSPSHPYANPVMDNGYERSSPETPPARQGAWGAYGGGAASADANASSTALPTQSPTRPLPPLRVPQPVRHSSTSTADFSATSWSSSAPLMPQAPSTASGHGHQPRQSSIDEVVGGGGSRPLPQRPPGKAPSAWSMD